MIHHLFFSLQEIAGRAVAVDWAVAKAQYKSGNAEGEGPDSDIDASDDPDKDDMGASDSDVDSDDDAAPKKKKQKKSGDGDGEDDEADDDGEDAEKEKEMLHSVMEGLLEKDDDDDDEGDDGDDEEDDEDEAEGDDEDDEETDGAKQRGEQAQDEVKPRPAPDQTTLNKTVFVRGLPLDVTKITLQAKMEGYGRVKACRIVMDKTTGKPKGTAFVEFEEDSGARRASDACARGR